MRRHLSMEELARDVLTTAASAQNEKLASERPTVSTKTELGELLYKCAEEIRTSVSSNLTYADIAMAAEARRAR